MASYAAREIATNAVEATGGAPARDHGSRWTRFAREQARALAASRRLAAVHASVRSVWFRNSVRGATGLAIAVLVAQLASVQHAFWVVLGALSVLRSSALGTGSTILRALGGTALGIVVGGALLVAIGGDRTLLWALLPVAVALAAYSPRAISFAAGQAGFTVTVLILFNLIEPSGWKVGLVRIEDVSIGFAISLVVGLLFWPTGARALLRASVADALVRAADYVGGAFERLFGGGETNATAPLRDEAVAAERRLDAALRQRLAERQGQSVALDACGALSAGATRVRRTADAMEYHSGRIGATPRPPEIRDVLEADVRALREWHLALGSALASRTRPPPAHQADAGARPAILAAVRAAAAGGDRARTVAALATGWGAMHVATLTELEARLAQAAQRFHR